jgi:Arc/MetJ family transcription regulator
VTAVRTTVDLDAELVRKAFELTGLRTKKALLHAALEELIRARQKTDLADLAGRIRFRDGFDHEELRRVRGGDR